MRKKRIQKRERTNSEQRQNICVLEHPVINRTYKDTLFRMIFREKKNLLQLYNALNNTNYRDVTDLEVITLENAIYMNMKNDVAFLMADRLNLYEHQSTFNPNMPLRNLFYISREYEKLIEQQSLYSSTKIQIPNPHFIVFYNGTRSQAERTILKLSDLYNHPEEIPELELTVCMLNINKGYNNEILKQCNLLSEYIQYVDLVKTYAKSLPIEEAVELAVTEAIENDILTQFLQKYRREAIQVSIFEYDEEKELRLLRQAERKGALEEGRQQGIESGIRSLMENMKLSLNQAMDVLNIPTEEQAIYVARIHNK